MFLKEQTPSSHRLTKCSTTMLSRGTSSAFAASIICRKYIRALAMVAIAKVFASVETNDLSIDMYALKVGALREFTGSATTRQNCK